MLEVIATFGKRGVDASMVRWVLKDNFPKFGVGRLNEYGCLDGELWYVVYGCQTQ